MEKQNLTIKVSVETYQQLKTDVGKGRVSDFVEKLIVKELGSSEKKTEQEYQQFYSDSNNLKEAKRWQNASIESRAKFSKKKVK
ncbi:MAG: hypothetical protein LBR43_00185 [Spiroplasmataceae bacterium]|jgi:hypothetical protein|nr:hypothetical protein [Spiroplasmataceae bacterium]